MDRSTIVNELLQRLKIFVGNCTLQIFHQLKIGGEKWVYVHKQPMDLSLEQLRVFLPFCLRQKLAFPLLDAVIAHHRVLGKAIQSYISIEFKLIERDMI